MEKGKGVAKSVGNNSRTSEKENNGLYLRLSRMGHGSCIVKPASAVMRFFTPLPWKFRKNLRLFSPLARTCTGSLFLQVTLALNAINRRESEEESMQTILFSLPLSSPFCKLFLNESITLGAPRGQKKNPRDWERAF